MSTDSVVEQEDERQEDVEARRQADADEARAQRQAMIEDVVCKLRARWDADWKGALDIGANPEDDPRLQMALNVVGALWSSLPMPPHRTTPSVLKTLLQMISGDVAYPLVLELAIRCDGWKAERVRRYLHSKALTEARDTVGGTAWQEWGKPPAAAAQMFARSLKLSHRGAEHMIAELAWVGIEPFTQMVDGE